MPNNVTANGGKTALVFVSDNLLAAWLDIVRSPVKKICHIDSKVQDDVQRIGLW